MLIIWQCSCGNKFVSADWQHHVMDNCPTCHDGVDLEVYGCRFNGNPKVLKKFNYNFREELKLCAQEQDIKITELAQVYGMYFYIYTDKFKEIEKEVMRSLL